MRAFANGKMDLSQAEAVADLVGGDADPVIGVVTAGRRDRVGSPPAQILVVDDVHSGGSEETLTIVSHNVVAGVGQHQMWASQYWKFDYPYTWVNSGGLGTMGFAVPAAIGAKAGQPERTVWAIDGDGCFQMTAQELITATAEKIPVKIAILNNAYLGMVRQWQELFYERRYAATPLLSPDFAKLAEAFGLRSTSVSRRADVEPMIDMARSEVGSVVLDFRVDQEDTVYPMVPAGADLDAMIRRPSPSPIVETADD